MNHPRTPENLTRKGYCRECKRKSDREAKAEKRTTQKKPRRISACVVELTSDVHRINLRKRY